MPKLPTLRGLQAFEAVARFGNLATAADRLGITPSAVSHRIRGLEAELGVPLLHRSAGGLVLTEKGRRYQGPVEEAFALLAKATNDLSGPDLSRPLTVSLTTSIGVRWLMPRFHRFRALHPEIEIAILSTGRLADLVGGEADVALRYGAAPWEGLRAEPFLKLSVAPLCAPHLLPRIEGLGIRDAVAASTLIRVGNDDWELWLQGVGAAGAKPARQLSFADFSMAVAAACDGEGIVLGYFGFVDNEVSAGRLVQPFESTLKIDKAYYLTYPEERLADPRVQAFRDWVMAESTARETA